MSRKSVHIYRSRRNWAWLIHPVTSRREVRTQDELAIEAARLETSVGFDDLIEGPLRHSRLDVTVC